MMKKINGKGLVVLCMVCALLLLSFVRQPDETPLYSYMDFWALAENGGIESVTLSDQAEWLVTLKDGTSARTPNPRAQDSKERLLKMGISVSEASAAAPAALYAVLAAAGLILFFRFRKVGAAGMAKYAAVQANESIPSVTFSDVAVHEETLSAMRDLVSFLRSPEIFSRLGARPPKGVLLYGPPGTGKTLLARALAGEAKAPFFAMSGADFVQVYVGVGASRVRELFRKARKAGGGVIFIDEIDAIGKKRDNGNDEREQTLNALLTEMSGFSGADGIIVLAATNRLDTLDPALLREGRFDRRIQIDLPDQEQRERILRVHAQGKPLETSVSLSALAAQTALFSGAQLEALLNEAAIRAGRKGKETIGQEEIDQAFYVIIAGDERPGRLSDEEKRVTAYHEAGHALLTRLMTPDTEIRRVTIIPSSRGAAGYSMSISPDSLLHTKRELCARMAIALGGRAAEEMMLGVENVTTGAANDIQKAREIARGMAHDFAMGSGSSEKQAEHSLFLSAMENARQTLRQHERSLIRIAEALMKKETLNGDEIDEYIEIDEKMAKQRLLENKGGKMEKNPV